MKPFTSLLAAPRSEGRLLTQGAGAPPRAWVPTSLLVDGPHLCTSLGRELLEGRRDIVGVSVLYRAETGRGSEGVCWLTE